MNGIKNFVWGLFFLTMLGPCVPEAPAATNRLINATAIQVGPGGGVCTIPNATDTFALLAATQTLSNKTFASPTLSGTLVTAFGTGVLHSDSGGNITSSLVSMTADTAGTLSTTQGGTNLTSYTLGDTLYSSATNTLAKLLGNTTTTQKFLSMTGTGSAGAAPAWSTLVGANLPNPGASSLGGVESIAAVTHNFLTSISTSGVPAQAQPAFTDVSGTATQAQGGTGQTSLTSGFGTSGSGTPAIASGTYTPTLTGASGFSSATTQVWVWMRVGNVVTTSGRLDMVTATGANSINISLPTSSANFVSSAQGSGNGNSSNTQNNVGSINSNSGAATVEFVIPTGVAATTSPYFLHFTYQVI